MKQGWIHGRPGQEGDEQRDRQDKRWPQAPRVPQSAADRGSRMAMSQWTFSTLAYVAQFIVEGAHSAMYVGC